MDEFKDLISGNTELTEKQIFQIFYKVAERGDVIILKNDGMRITDQFTVVITSSNGEFDSIRFDDSSLNTALLKALRKYFKELPDSGDYV